MSAPGGRNLSFYTESPNTKSRNNKIRQRWFPMAMPHEVQSSIPAHKSRTPKVEGVSKLPGARVTGAASRGRRLTWQRCGMGQRTHAAAWLFQWWERVPGRRINGSGPERAPCRWATPEHEQERDAGLQALSHWWLRETYCRILCQAPVKQVIRGNHI